MIADMVMDIIRTRRERHIQKAAAKAIAEARPKIRAEAIAEGIAWNQRRLEADARGEPFDEPFPYADSEQGKDGD